MKQKIYVTGGISGYTLDQVHNHFYNRKSDLKEYYDVIIPMIKEDIIRTDVNEKGSPLKSNPACTNQAVMTRDFYFVSQADVILSDFSGCSDKVSIGMVCEMSMAFASPTKKHIVAVLPKDNIHQHAFINAMADVTFETYEEAREYLLDMARYYYC